MGRKKFLLGECFYPGGISLRGRRKTIQDLRKEYLQLSRLESKIWESGLVAVGVDESGRGALAGPLVAGAVALPANIEIPGLKECKQVSRGERERLYRIITERALAWQTAIINAQVIDRIGLQQANLMALTEAAEGLAEKLGDLSLFVLVDAFPLNPSRFSLDFLALIHGDRVSVSIAAASIISKVTRDRIMYQYHQKFPLYGFDQNVGYGTEKHLRALKKHGPCSIHRRSFGPIKERKAVN